jgi:hypothetical protein
MATGLEDLVRVSRPYHDATSFANDHVFEKVVSTIKIWLQ